MITAMPTESSAFLGTGELLMLLAQREARQIAMSEGTYSVDAYDDWLDSLTSAQHNGIDQWDHLVAANLNHLRAARDAAGA
jgi:hypothetical protein